jgi:hypothetical protein
MQLDDRQSPEGSGEAKEGQQSQNELCKQEDESLPAGLCNCMKYKEIIRIGSEIIFKLIPRGLLRDAMLVFSFVRSSLDPAIC